MNKPQLVLIHGWAGIPALWQSLVEQLAAQFDVCLLELPGFDSGDWPSDIDDKALIDSLLPQLPQQACYVGWSMGGNIAALIAHYYPERVQALALLASNPCFVADGDWPGMEVEQFAHFQQQLELDVLKTLLEFQFLVVSGHRQKRQLLRQMADISKRAKLTKGNLSASLNWLGSSDCRRQIQTYCGPKLALLAREDALVPAAIAPQLQALGLEVQLLDDNGHAPLLSIPEVLAPLLSNFFNKSLRQRYKKAVAESFGKAAASYDGAAQLQRDICDQLLSLLPAKTAERILELGCGTGYAITSLQQRGPELLLSSDLALGMLQHVQRESASAEKLLTALDAQQIPFADSSFELVFSSLALQWCDDNRALFSEIERVLAPGGCAYIATLGPQTLFELKRAWAEVDDRVHVNDFASLEALEQAAVSAGLQFEYQTELRQPKYHKLTGLMAELKAIGAHNVSEQRPKGLTGKRKLQAVINAYEGFRQGDGLLPASYEVFYLVLHKPKS